MHVINLSDCNTNDTSLIGGKASSLAFMIANAIRVPNGFVITTAAGAEMTPELKSQIIEKFEQLGAQYVAVRSSAAAEDGVDDSWAGQLETYLNVEKEDLFKSIEKCWNSASSARAQTYAEMNNVEMKAVSVAVIVQEMIQSEVAGVAFSINPITGDSNEIIVEAAFGLGEAVVSGEVTPDNYVINKIAESVEKYLGTQTKKLHLKDGTNVWTNLDENIQSSQKMTDPLIDSLAEQVIKIEKLYSKPVDIEWAVHDNKVYITQSRPITTL